MEEIDNLIVGQGLAGTLLSHCMIAKGASLKVIDPGHVKASSLVAAGIMNPVTGYRFVKSWMIDELLPIAKETYENLEKIVACQFYFETEIHRALKSTGEENSWLERSAGEEVRNYIDGELIEVDYSDYFKGFQSWVRIQKSARLDMPLLIKKWRNYLKENNQLIDTAFFYEKLEINSDHFIYNGIKTKRIIFCEGHQVINNPWFGDIKIQAAKGEVLFLKIPDLKTNKMIKHDVFFIRQEDDVFWVGSNYDWNFKDEKPTKLGKKNLIEKVEKVLKLPYEIVDFKAAIRPTVKDRRPLLGRHPVFNNLFVFNGLGTKGASIGPCFAWKMADFILEGTPLDKIVDANR